jgi:hypothetical protein
MSWTTSLLSIPVVAALLADPSTSHRTGASTFREDDRGLSVWADGYPASWNPDSNYVPVPVAVALMRNGASITFTLESFTLVDAEGNRVPAAGYAELHDSYPRLWFDLSVARLYPIALGQNVPDRPQLSANFYDARGAGTKIGRVELAAFSWFTDMIYFPRPPAGLGGVMTLSVEIPGGDPINVRFLMRRDELAKR